MIFFFLVVAFILAAIAGVTVRTAMALWTFRRESLLCDAEVIAVEQKILHDSDGATIEYQSKFTFRARGKAVLGSTLRGRPLRIGSSIPVRYLPGREEAALVWLPPHGWWVYLASAMGVLGGVGVMIGFRDEIDWPIVSSLTAAVFCIALSQRVDVADVL